MAGTLTVVYRRLRGRGLLEHTIFCEDCDDPERDASSLQDLARDLSEHGFVVTVGETEAVRIPPQRVVEVRTHRG